MVARIDAAELDPDQCVLLVAMLPDGTAYVQVADAVTGPQVAAALRQMAERFDDEGIDGAAT